MQGILLVTVMAVTVEALVEYGRTILSAAKGGDRTAAILQGAAVLLSVGLCMLTGADLYGALGITFVWKPMGCLLTGIFSARGANYVSDFIGQLRNLLTHTA